MNAIAYDLAYFNQKQKSILVDAVKRHLNAKLNIFIEQFSHCLEKVTNEQTFVICYFFKAVGKFFY